MVLSLTGRAKNTGQNHFYVKIPPQVVGAARHQDNSGAMLNHSGVKSAEQSTFRGLINQVRVLARKPFKRCNSGFRIRTFR